jgi:hypothetical protein
MVCVCGGCVVFVPMRVPTHNQTAAWVPVQQKADLSFIRPGVTQREGGPPAAGLDECGDGGRPSFLGRLAHFILVVSLGWHIP